MTHDLFTEPHAHRTQPNEPQGAAGIPHNDLTKHWTPAHRQRVEALYDYFHQHFPERARRLHGAG